MSPDLTLADKPDLQRWKELVSEKNLHFAEVVRRQLQEFPVGDRHSESSVRTSVSFASNLSSSSEINRLLGYALLILIILLAIVFLIFPTICMTAKAHVLQEHSTGYLSFLLSADMICGMWCYFTIC